MSIQPFFDDSGFTESGEMTIKQIKKENQEEQTMPSQWRLNPINKKKVKEKKPKKRDRNGGNTKWRQMTEWN